MLFLNWSLFGSLMTALLVISAVVWVMKIVRRSNLWVRIPIIIATIPIGLIAALFILLMALAQVSGCNSHGVPVYSPNGKSAARVETDDEGATGGGTGVQLYSVHGFWTSSVFYGGWKSVEDQDLEWQSDTNLVVHYVHYGGYREADNCHSFGEIHVTCVPKPMK
jgi:hypothetical protein